MTKQGFTEPTLYNYNGDLIKEWYVGFRHTDPTTGIRKPFQVRVNINFHPDAAQRSQAGKELILLLRSALHSSWNPHIEDINSFIVRTTNPANLITQKGFNDALDFAFKSKSPNLSKKSKSDICGVKDFAKAAAIKLSIQNMPVGETDRPHIKLILEQIGKDRQAAYIAERERRYNKILLKHNDPNTADRLTGKPKEWTGNSYNKYRYYLQILFTELKEYKAVSFNPCLEIAAKPEIDTNIHRHATEKEIEIIKETLRNANMHFFVYIAALTLTGIRPKELFGLQVCDIDWFIQCFDLQATDEKSKTRTARKVPIPNSLLRYLEMLNLENADADDYIFSNGFKPGPIRKNRADYATKLWKVLIKDGLGINVSMYSMKGKGGEYKRNAGIDIGFVSGGFGHANTNMTKVYLHGEQDRMNKQIIEQTPEF